MKKLLLILIVTCALLFSCNKNTLDIAPDKVQVQIENATAYTIDNATVGNLGYGSINKGQLTGYKTMDQPIYAGYCVFTVDGALSSAGVLTCGTPSPPPLAPGFYTYKITSEVNGNNTLTVIRN